MTDQTKRATTEVVDTYADSRGRLAVHVDTREEPVPMVRIATASQTAVAEFAANGGRHDDAHVLTLSPSGMHALRRLLDEALADGPTPSTTGWHYEGRPTDVHDVEPVEVELDEDAPPLTPVQEARVSAVHHAATLMDASGSRWFRNRPGDLLQVARWIVDGDAQPAAESTDDDL